MKYLAVNTQAATVDLSPVLGYALTSKLSVGAGLDVLGMQQNLTSYAVLINETTNALSTSSLKGAALGYHFGILYDFSPNTRLGFNYRSQFSMHLSGNNSLQGVLADIAAGTGASTSHITQSIILPPTTTLSVYQAVNPRWVLLGTVDYTQWTLIKAMTINNLVGVNNDLAFENINVSIPLFLRNTWNIALGTTYELTERWKLRTGIGFDESSVDPKYTTVYRTVQIPDSNRYALAFGAHYQASKAIGLDLGWTHFFIEAASVSHPQQIGPTVTVTPNGTFHNSADVFGAQITWKI